MTLPMKPKVEGDYILHEDGTKTHLEAMLAYRKYARDTMRYFDITNRDKETFTRAELLAAGIVV